MTARRWLRSGLVVLGITNGATGAWALLGSRSFFDGLPGVALLPPFNQHLVFDVGALLLALAVTLLAAAATPHPVLVRTALASYLVFAIPHTLFHATHLQGFPLPDAIAQTASMVAFVLVAVALLALTGASRVRRARPVRPTSPPITPTTSA